MILSWIQQPKFDKFVVAQIASDDLVRDAIDVQAPWHFGVTALIFLVCLFVVLCLYLTEANGVARSKIVGIAILRVAAVGLILFMLYRATSNQIQAGKPLVAVVLDNSRSMERKDSLEKATTTSRFDLAKDFLLDEKWNTLEKLSERHNVHVSTLDNSLVIDSSKGESPFEIIRTLKPTYESSPIGNRVKDVLRNQQGRGVAAIILLTDGNSNVGISLASLRRSTPVPITCVGFGRERLPLDVAIELPPLDESIFLGDTIDLRPSIKLSELKGKTVSVSLIRNGETKIATEEIVVESDTFQTQIEFSDRPLEPGSVVYEIVATEFDEEENRQNNRLTTTVLVKEERLRVLLLQSTPGYEFRNLKNILERESFLLGDEPWFPIQLTTLLQNADHAMDTIDRSMVLTLPNIDGGLTNYDVIVFGDVDPSQLPASFENELVDFVKEQGRGAIFIAGENFTPVALADSKISTLFPFSEMTTAVETGREFRFRKTPIASTLNFVASFDSDEKSTSVFWRYPQVRLRPGVRSLAELVDSDNGTVSPAISLSYSGKGRVLFHFFDGLYRLKTDINDERISEYWLQAVRFLGRHKLNDVRQPKIEVLPREPRYGESIVVNAFLPRAFSASGEVSMDLTLFDTEGRQRRIELNREATSEDFTGKIEKLEPGGYRLQFESVNSVVVEREFSVTENDIELEVPTADFESLKSLSRETGGRFYSIQQAAKLVNELETIQTERRRVLQSKPIWNSAPIVLLFFVIISTEWILRRRYGMA